MISYVPSSPTTLGGRYELLEVVGRGGMGEVWAGRDLRLGRSVAVKLLSPTMASEAGVRERFDEEARSAARLSHPNVVLVFDSGEHEGTPYLVMELLPGRTLADEVARGPLEPERARRIGLEVLGALGASHGAGILHRDIKPGNVLLAADDTAKLGDFGIAKSAEGLNLTSTGMIVGTAAYLAPERVAGQPATPESDLYAVGVVLYEALSGRKPFQADTPIGLMRAVEAHQAVPLAEACPGLDSSLAATVERAMAKDPARRFSSAAAMAAALRGAGIAAAPGTPTVPTAVPSSTRVLAAPTARQPAEPGRPPLASVATDRWERLRRSPGTVLAVILVAVFLFVVVLATRDGGSPSAPSGETSATTSQTPAGGSLPEPLDRAIKSLEEAVQP
ncbi:MAG TPA: serine/threonine-protein kinase [Acidimicrobiales bacterium]|nr:serine/threonine-protein kinase [Acidimicrobiales bacterium]